MMLHTSAPPEICEALQNGTQPLVVYVMLSYVVMDLCNFECIEVCHQYVSLLMPMQLTLFCWVHLVTTL